MNLIKCLFMKSCPIFPRGGYYLWGARKWCAMKNGQNSLHRNPNVDLYPCYKVNTKGMISESYAFGDIEEQKRCLINDGKEIIENKVDIDKYGGDI